ncbi:hypothetical protein [Grimontia sp. SpTr1]|uniref:hypothetical protein n=1 Tax=Grimontia sp. SpTr1 TaxID=2995319 RepID=UPI00248AEEDF|nr:hypothetical protein [Grimontia sp. SpTr1]
MKKNILIFLVTLNLAACATSNSVMFYTKTSISILDADTAPVGVSIGYERDEGFIGPRYENGAVPPVIASVESNAEIINPTVSELYATGGAAIAATDENYQPSSSPPLSGNKELMFFGTSTSLGLSVNALNNVPNSISIGYKRKTLSYIPLGTDPQNKVDTYPSVFASIETNIQTIEKDGSYSQLTPSVKNKQYIATGVSAENIANELKGKFIERANNPFNQSALSASLLACYFGVKDEQKLSVWRDADHFDLYHEAEDKKGTTLKDLEKLHGENEIDKADRIYSSLVIINIEQGLNQRNKDGEKPDIERAKNLARHKDAVCMLSRGNT